MEPVGQWAAKLLAVKVGVFKKKSATSAIPPELCASAIAPGSSLSGFESFSKFDREQLCRPLTYRTYNTSKERSKPP